MDLLSDIDWIVLFVMWLLLDFLTSSNGIIILNFLDFPCSWLLSESYCANQYNCSWTFQLENELQEFNLEEYLQILSNVTVPILL
jgi:hypothetical protein